MADRTSVQNKYAYKRLPIFDPIHSRAWASCVRDAFAEREWAKFLELPKEGGNLQEINPSLLIQAKAFLTQSIPFEHQYGLEDYTTAAQIFNALEQHYNTQSREDELRLESLLIDMRKSPTDMIDEHISKFTSLMASVLAQQSTKQKYDHAKRNLYFIRTLIHARIEDENWIGFQTYLGQSWTILTPESMYAEARSWYESNIRPFKHTTTANDSDARVLAINTGNMSLGKHSIPVYGQPKYFGNKPQKQGKFKGSTNSKRADLPRDTNAWV